MRTFDIFKIISARYKKKLKIKKKKIFKRRGIMSEKSVIVQL